MLCIHGEQAAWNSHNMAAWKQLYLWQKRLHVGVGSWTAESLIFSTIMPLFQAQVSIWSVWIWSRRDATKQEKNFSCFVEFMTNVQLQKVLWLGALWNMRVPRYWSSRDDQQSRVCAMYFFSSKDNISRRLTCSISWLTGHTSVCKETLQSVERRTTGQRWQLQFRVLCACHESSLESLVSHYNSMWLTQVSAQT